MDADWDLLAVVRGCTTASTAAPTTSPPLIAPATADFEADFEHLLSKPFPPKIISPPLMLQQSKQPQQIVFQSNPPRKEYSPFIFGSSASATVTTSGGSVISEITPHVQRSNLLCLSSTTSPHSHQRSKKRKNLQKRVCHVGAEGLSSDMWAWRKYGQKPIKGSPYPRGYYRCSSSKGCLARKQVERNRSDPKMFIITYTSEHNHPMPTHRNSLAGSTRNKPTSDADAATNSTEEAVGGGGVATDSPAGAEKGDEIKEGYEEEMDFKDMVMNDDFFVGFEELNDSDGGDLDFFPDQIQGSLEMDFHLVGQQE